MTETEENLLAGERVEDFSGMVSKHTAGGVCFYASPACRDLLGYEPGDLIGRSLRELVHPEDRAGVERFYSKLAASQNAGVVSYRALREDGTYVRLEATGWAMPDPDTGDVGEIVTVSRGAVSPGAGAPRVPAQETTERRRAEDALRDGGEMYRAVVEHVAENIFVVDVETGCVLEANAAFSESLGYGPRETQTLTLYDVVAHDRESIDRNIRLVLERGSLDVGERRYRRADGTLMDVEVKVSVIRYRRGRALCVVAHDVTERRRTEEELRKSHALLSAVVEGIPDAVFVKDLRGRYLLVNGVAAGTIRGPGSAAEDIIGQDDTEFFSPEVAEALMELDRLIMETGEVRVAEELVPLDGEDKVYLSTKAPCRDHRGEIIGVIGVSTDITESKEVEKALFEVREAERGRIARDLHDTVLHHLVGVLQTMQASQIEDPEERGELAWQVEALRGAIQGLRNAIYNLRPERTAPFVRTIESLVELNRHLAPDCEFVVRAEDGPFREPFETAKVDLVRIVQEALTNARRHSGAGRVEVRLEADADGEFLAEVADDGRGLDPETDLDGVGLSAMRERALVMGARLVIASVPGGGTRVRVSVPDREPGGAPGRRPGPRG